MGVGLVDYKVCAVDATWSGMTLGKRRKAQKKPRPLLGSAKLLRLY